MMNPLLTNKYEEEILQLIDHQDDYTRGDLQGIVTGIVNRILVDGSRLVNDLNEQLMSEEQRVILFALEAHRLTLEQARSGETDHQEVGLLNEYIEITDRLLQKFAA